MPIENGQRLPCIRCGHRLYYNEQAQDYCGKCAKELGISRICDRPWGVTQRRPEKKLLERTPATILLEET